jgi:hypothetical protein
VSDDGDLKLLLETEDPIELAGVRALLEGHDIEFVVQGENHAAMIVGMFGNPIVVPRVLVAERDFEKAHALLEASPDNETQQGESLEGAVCPVHEKQALATCGRCGSFLCADCKALGQPPLCEDCLARDEAERHPKKAPPSMKLFIAVVGGAVLLGFLILRLAR